MLKIEFSQIFFLGSSPGDPVWEKYKKIVKIRPSSRYFSFFLFINFANSLEPL